MRILVGMPENSARGGINACEPPFLQELERAGNIVRQEIYSFDNPFNISTSQRVSKVLKTARKFRRILQKENFDIVHLNTAFDKNAVLRDFVILSAIKSKKIKTFLKFHGSDIALLHTKSTVFRNLWKKLVEKSDGIGVLSSEERENFIRAGISGEKVFVVKNAVSNRPEVIPQQSFDNSHNSPFRLLFVARMISTKGLVETIKACSILKDRNFNFFLNVLGDGEIRNYAEKLSKDLGLEDFIKFCGYVSEERVRVFYDQSDALVFPTYHQEGFPMVIFNAMAHGLPIITTKMRAAADYLRDNENCLFCEPKNVEDIASKIIRLYKNGDLCKKMSKNNIMLAGEFSAEKIVPEYLEIYSRIVAR